MSLTQTQRGIVGQDTAYTLIVVGADGAVVVACPPADDYHVDWEAHRRPPFRLTLELQVKTTWRLWTHRHSEIIQIPFSLPANRLVRDPRLFYFFGYFDRACFAFRDPVFLVPSRNVYSHAMPRLVDGRWRFTFQASLKPDAHDRWSPFQIPTDKVGRRVLEIIGGLDKNATTSLTSKPTQALPDSLRITARTVRRRFRLAPDARLSATPMLDEPMKRALAASLGTVLLSACDRRHPRHPAKHGPISAGQPN